MEIRPALLLQTSPPEATLHQGPLRLGNIFFIALKLMPILSMTLSLQLMLVQMPVFAALLFKILSISTTGLVCAIFPYHMIPR